MQGVFPLDYGDGGFPSFDDGLFGSRCLGDFMLEEVGRGERVVAPD